MITTIVLTGGPCAGKTSVLKALRNHLGREAIFVEEAATSIFKKHPLPTDDWTDGQWFELQQKIAIHQISCEARASWKAQRIGCRLRICDRGLFDGCAYPMGQQAVREQVGTHTTRFGHSRYHLVIHLESQAIAFPERFSRAGNRLRYEKLEQAQRLDHQTRLAWEGHPNWKFLPGTLSISELVHETLALIRTL
ncbi:MAG: ATP-binding protein [Candidatus Andersenbacteria bacterium]|nr:ATP-binding protein [Candidatus Andersenbacteria bacterium]MBI3250679.1 ATP-binding protein [Candidatus Andersenbacteria bacterium]